jgi:anti-sigma B factor antagonist
MEIKEQKGDNFITLCPVGELDAISSIHMDERLNSLLEKGHINFHFDCSEMTYISSAGLGVFISHIEEIRGRKGKLIFSGMTDNVFDVFSLLGLDKIVTIQQDDRPVDYYFNA